MLFSFSLASRKKESNSFSIHPLVHSWARERLTPMIGRAKATASLQMISCAVATTKSRKIDIDRHLIQHIQICSRLAFQYISSINDDYKKEFAWEWYSFGGVYYQQGWYSEAEVMWKLALAGFEKALGPEDLVTIAVVQDFGMLCNDRGKLHEAETLWGRALVGFEKALEPEHPKTLATSDCFTIVAASLTKRRQCYIAR